MIGALVAAYMATEKKASFGKAALYGVGIELAIPVVLGIVGIGALAGGGAIAQALAARSEGMGALPPPPPLRPML